MNNNNGTIINIRDAIIYFAGLISGILIPFIRKWIKSEQQEYCSFPASGESKQLHQVIVTKKFNKTTYINCGRFQQRQDRVVDNIHYKFCFYGNHLHLSENKDVYQCPFDKQMFFYK